ALGKLAFENVGTFQSWDAEERGEVSRIAAERRADVGNAAVNFLMHAFERQFAEADRMMVAMSANGVAFLIDAAHRCRERMRHLADHEESRLDALRRQNVEDLIGIRGQRAV